MSAGRRSSRRIAAGAAIGVLLLAGCGGSDDKKATPQPPGDRTQRTEAGARATLREYAIAFTTTDANKLCDLLDPTSATIRSVSKQRCRRDVEKLKNVLTPAEAESYRAQTLKLRPVVKGDVATLPGKTEPSLRYVGGRWYVIPVPAEETSPPS